MTGSGGRLCGSLAPKCYSSAIRHKQPVRHSLLEMPDDVRLGPRDGDGQHVTFGGHELDHVGAVVLRAVDHDAVLAVHHTHDSNSSPIAPPMMAARSTISRRRWLTVTVRPVDPYRPTRRTAYAGYPR
jgi:hypothetical protein